MSTLQVTPASYEAKPLRDGSWLVTSPAGKTYGVDPEAGLCSCPDFQARGHRRACKNVRCIRGLLELVPCLSHRASKAEERLRSNLTPSR